jgi:hypothetical protein
MDFETLGVVTTERSNASGNQPCRFYKFKIKPQIYDLFRSIADFFI